MFSVVWVTVGLLPLWHDLKIHITSSYHLQPEIIILTNYMS